MDFGLGLGAELAQVKRSGIILEQIILVCRAGQGSPNNNVSTKEGCRDRRCHQKE